MKPTVLLLTTTFDVGGAERVYVEVAKGLSRRGYRVLAACLQLRSGLVLQEFRDTGVECVDLGMTSKASVGAWLRLLRVMRAYRVDVLYTFLFHANVIGRIVGRLAGVPIILSSQQIMDWEGLGRELLNRTTARWCTRIVAVSKNVERYCTEWLGIPKDKVVTIYNCIHSGLLTDGNGPQRRWMPPEDAWTVGFVARFFPEKDHDTLIDAFVRVRKQFPEARLILAGEGPERSRVMRRVEQMGLSAGVEFLGHVHDVGAVYARLAVYVQSSHVEGLPCSVLEALAWGLPVVATRVGGTEEVVVHGQTGLLAAPRDPEALAGAIGWMLANREEARRMGERGRREVAGRFTAGPMVESTHRLITELRRSTAQRYQV